MKRLCFLMVVVFVLMLPLGSGHCWQGRMAGMGDPFGLVQDEADFLIHPTKILDGRDTRLYAHYRFTYKNVGDLNWTSDLVGGLVALIPGISLSWDFENDGDVFLHEGLVGAAFPFLKGRMGIFFTYNGKRADFDGSEQLDFSTVFLGAFTASVDLDTDLESDLDDFALRALYAFPVGKIRLGTELSLAYIQEENRWKTELTSLLVNGSPPPVPIILRVTNDPTGFLFSNLGLMYPYDSDYWQFSFKGSAQGNWGPVEVVFSHRVGLLFGGDNHWDYDLDFQIPSIVRATDSFDLDGEAEGWNMDSDLWVRIPLSCHVSLPLLLRASYQRVDRDGKGVATPTVTGLVTGSTTLRWDYDSTQSAFRIEGGGGVDWKVDDASRFSAGLYYNYLKGKDDLTITPFSPDIGAGLRLAYGDYPDTREHQIKLRLTGERAFSPSFTLRAGLDTFYGWVEEDYDLGLSVVPAGLIPIPGSILEVDTALEGSHWGITASVGATLKFQQWTLEPFINGGYEALNLDGDQEWKPLPGLLPPGVIGALVDVDKERTDLFIGGGFSILFDL